MNEQIQLFVAFIIYISIFGWIGSQLSARRMQWLFAVTVVSYLFVFFAGSATIIRMLNLASKALTFVRAGGLGANPDAAMGQIGNAPQIITLEGTYIFLWLVWVISLVVAFRVITQRVQKGPSDAYAIMWGIAGGILLLWCLLPMMLNVIAPNVIYMPETPTRPVLRDQLLVAWNATKVTWAALGAYIDRLALDANLGVDFGEVWRATLLAGFIYIVYTVFKSREQKQTNIPYSNFARFLAIVFMVYLAIQIYLGTGGIKIW